MPARRVPGLLAPLPALLLAGCIAGFPSGPVDPGYLPERITVLAVSAAAAPAGGAGPAVLLTFRVRNDAAETADRIRLHVRAFKADTVVGAATGPDVWLRVGREAAIPVRVAGPATPDALDCYEYRVEALIDGHIGQTPPVRRCL